MLKVMKMKKVAVICAAALILLYIAESVAVSVALRGIVKSSYDSYGADNPYRATISDDIYERMCYRRGYTTSSADGPNASERETLLGPVALHWFCGGKALYWYWYEIYDASGALAGGSAGIPVTLDFALSSGSLLITNYYEAP